MFAFFFITTLRTGTLVSCVVFGVIWEANFRVIFLTVAVSGGVPLVGLIGFFKVGKLLLRLGPGERERYRLLSWLSERSPWLFWETFLSVRDDLATASWISVRRLRTNSVKVSREVSVLILLTPEVCNFTPSISRKEWVSTAACSAASASAGFALRTSHRTVGLDKPAIKVVRRISFRTASTG